MKNVLFSEDAREKLKKGVDLVANSVKITLGPRGRNMIYGFHHGYPVCTKDGVTVAREVESKDPAEKLGLLLVRQVAQKTADDAGDGTTTATLLAQEIFTEGLKVLKSGANPILIKRGIDKAVDDVVKFLDTYKTKLDGDEQIIKVASLAANNDQSVGAIVNEAVKQAGEDGVITIEDNYQGADTYVEIMEGMQLMEGLVSPYFITDPIKMEAIQLNPYLIILDSDISSVNQIKGILEKALNSGRPVCLMANTFHGMVLQNLVQSRMKNNIPLICVKSPYFGDFRSEQLSDIAALTGGKVIGPISGLKPELAELDDLGVCGSIKANKHHTTIVDGKGIKEIIEGRIVSIKQQIEKCESDYDKEKFRERLSKLTTGVAVIKVGAPTDVEQKEKKMRVEDSLLAARAAIEDGIVPGGGLALLHAIDSIQESGTEEDIIGQRIIKKALRAPIKQIAANAGLEGAEIIANIKIGRCKIFPVIGPLTNFSELPKDPYGYNFLTNEYGDLMEMGVIDPVKVVKTTLINAASVAGMLLTTEVICSEDEEMEITRTPKPR